MKIGILTFHWGTNYGGVLQAYALQSYLKEKEYDVEIINYAPITYRDGIKYCLKTKSMKYAINNLSEYLKELKFKQFRNKYLNLSRRYYHLNDMEEIYSQYDAIVVGSDQVWNPYIALTYGKPYFLPQKGFIKKIGYAISLGCIKYPEDILEKLSKYINDFTAISFREKTAVNIMTNTFPNKQIQCTIDPTLLAGNKIYRNLITSVPGCFYYFYTLQNDQKLINMVESYLSSVGTVKKTKQGYFSNDSIENWLSNINNCKCLITNSFHGVAFAILLHKNFIVLPIEGKMEGMNDRIYTLLDSLKMRYRILFDFDKIRINNLISEHIDWTTVDMTIDKLKQSSKEYLLNNLL